VAFALTAALGCLTATLMCIWTCTEVAHGPGDPTWYYELLPGRELLAPISRLPPFMMRRSADMVYRVSAFAAGNITSVSYKSLSVSQDTRIGQKHSADPCTSIRRFFFRAEPAFLLTIRARQYSTHDTTHFISLTGEHF
jgi:hypothetical protein